jgi:ribose transport system substrate-binding protein
MGFKGIQTVVGVIEKKAPPKFVDTGVVMVDKDNIDQPVAKNVLY